MTMNVKSSKPLLTCAATMAVVLAAGAYTSAQQPTSEARIQEVIRQAAERAGISQATTASPATPQTTPQGQTAPTVKLTLDDAVKLALDRNLDIAVQRLNPEINDIAIASIRSVYHPNLTSTISTQSVTTPSTNSIAGAAAGSPVNQGTASFNGGVAQSIPWGGGSFNVSLNNTRRTSNALISNYNPYYQPLWQAQYTQPILRGFSIDTTRQQLQVTQINRDISDVQLKSTVTNTVSNVRNAYWDYVFAVQSVEVARQSVDLANKLVQDNQTRVQVGTMAPIDVVQAQAQAATAQQNLVGAQATMRTAELALKRLIVGGTSDPNWNAELDPIDRPEFQPEEVDIEAAVRRALSQRTDLEIAKKNVQANSVTLKYLNNQVLPQADLTAAYGLNGLGGTRIERTASGIGGQGGTIANIFPGGYGDALSSLWSGNNPQWSVALNISYPLGLSSQEASVARARVQLNQVQAQLKQIELQVATDVTNAAVNVRSNAERVQAAQVARELAQRQLDAENSKFAVGMSTNYFVVQAQNQLATAQNNELQAILNYRKSQVELDRLQQTTLQNQNITILNAAGGGGGAAVGTAVNTGQTNIQR
jgi:outer membrane protein TolC